MFRTSLHRKVARKTVQLHHKVLSTVQSRRVHRHVFHYAVTAHFVHVAVSTGSLRTFESAIAFAASLGTLLMHLTEKHEPSEQGIGGDADPYASWMFGKRLYAC